MSTVYYMGKFEQKDGEQTFYGDWEITKEEYDKFVTSNETLGRIVSNYDYYEMLMSNVDEVLSVIHAFEAKRDSFVYSNEIEPYVRELNRTFINALGSFACYLNHYEYVLKTKYDDNSIFDKFKKVCNTYFDSYFAYRFFYKLRNYVVHCNIPVTLLESTANCVEETFYIDVSELLEEFDWGKIVKEDLEGLEADIGVKDFITAVRGMLMNLNKDILFLDEDRIKDAMEYLKSVLLVDENGEAHVPAIIMVDDEDASKMQVTMYGDNFLAACKILGGV